MSALLKTCSTMLSMFIQRKSQRLYGYTEHMIFIGLKHLQFYDPWVCREGLSSISFSGEVCFHTPECVWKAPSAGRLQAGGGVVVLTMSYFQPEQNCLCWNTLICVSRRKILSQCHAYISCPPDILLYTWSLRNCIGHAIFINITNKLWKSRHSF